MAGQKEMGSRGVLCVQASAVGCWNQSQRNMQALNGQGKRFAICANVCVEQTIDLDFQLFIFFTIPLCLRPLWYDNRKLSLHKSKQQRCGISVAVCIKAMKQLVFYVHSCGSDSWWLLGAVSSYSTGGPSLHYNGVKEAEQFQPSCRGKNQTKSGCWDTA